MYNEIWISVHPVRHWSRKTAKESPIAGWPYRAVYVKVPDSHGFNGHARGGAHLLSFSCPFTMFQEPDTHLNRESFPVTWSKQISIQDPFHTISKHPHHYTTVGFPVLIKADFNPGPLPHQKRVSLPLHHSGSYAIICRSGLWDLQVSSLLADISGNTLRHGNVYAIATILKNENLSYNYRGK